LSGLICEQGMIYHCGGSSVSSKSNNLQSSIVMTSLVVFLFSCLTVRAAAFASRKGAGKSEGGGARSVFVSSSLGRLLAGGLASLSAGGPSSLSAGGKPRASSLLRFRGPPDAAALLCLCCCPSGLSLGGGTPGFAAAVELAAAAALLEPWD
jgi:hypothetical protein